MNGAIQISFFHFLIQSPTDPCWSRWKWDWPRWFSRKIIFSLSQYFKKSIHCDIHFDLKKTKKRNNPYEGNFFFQKLDLSLSLKPVYKIFLSLLNYPKWITIPKKKQRISSNGFQWLPTILDSVPKTSFRDSKSRENCRTSIVPPSLFLDRLQIVNKNRGIKFRR